MAQDEFGEKGKEIERILHEAEEQWRSLETQLEEEENRYLEVRFGSLQTWFGVDEAELKGNWHVGSLRHTIHDRVQKLLSAPLVEKMQQRVGPLALLPDEDVEASLEKQKPVEALAAHWRDQVGPMLKEANKEDVILQKKIRKTERDERQKGVVSVHGDTKKVAALKRTRPAIWEASQIAMDKVSNSIQRLCSFFADEMSPTVVRRLVLAVPAVVSRAICDWYFQKCVIELDELDTWWHTTKDGLEQRGGSLWEELEEKEGYMMRRIERGMEEIRSRKNRYSIYANFGGSEIEVMRCVNAADEVQSAQKLDESVTLLATVVSEIHQRLKQIRDSAMWRVIGTAKSIHEEEVAAAPETPPWAAVDAGEATLALFGVLEAGEASPPLVRPRLQGSALVDAALAVLQRLERFASLAADLKTNLPALVPKAPDTGLGASLDESVAVVTALTEDLLVLMDEPTTASLKAWLQQWGHMRTADVAQRLEAAVAALPLPMDSKLKPPERSERQKWLALARGFVAFLQDAAIRGRTIEPLQPASPQPPAAAAPAMIPGTSSRSETPALSVADVDLDICGLFAPESPRQVTVSPVGAAARPGSRGGLAGPRPGSAAGRPGSAAVQSRPGSRGGPASVRPETPSTACEDSGPAPRPLASKFVDGQLVAPRPGSGSGSRPLLPPLRSGPLPGGFADAQRPH